MNTYKTCQGCPDRCVGCHGTCPGYQAREAEKQQRYADKNRSYAEYPLHAAYERKITRNIRLAQLGQSTR